MLADPEKTAAYLKDLEHRHHTAALEKVRREKEIHELLKTQVTHNE